MTRRDSLFVSATNVCRLHKDVALYESRRRKTPLPPKGRTCADCDTVLSTYNRTPTCYLHDPHRLLQSDEPRDERIAKMVKAGMSFAEVGGLFDLTGSAVHKIARRQGVRSVRAKRTA